MSNLLPILQKPREGEPCNHCGECCRMEEAALDRKNERALIRSEKADMFNELLSALEMQIDWRSSASQTRKMTKTVLKARRLSARDKAT